MDKQWVKVFPVERSWKDQVVANSSKNGHKYTFYLSVTNSISYNAWVAHKEHLLATLFTAAETLRKENILCLQ